MLINWTEKIGKLKWTYMSLIYNQWHICTCFSLLVKGTKIDIYGQNDIMINNFCCTKPFRSNCFMKIRKSSFKTTMHPKRINGNTSNWITIVDEEWR